MSVLLATVDYETSGSAQLQSITYNFGDNSTTPPTSATTQGHTYAAAGTYAVSATLTFTGSAASSPSTCQTSVSISSTAPVATTASATTTPTTPAPASQLVNTGPGDDVFALFGITTVAGIVGYRIFLRRTNRV